MKFVLLLLALVFCVLHLQQAKRPLLIAIAALGAGLLLSVVDMCSEPLIYRVFGAMEQGGLWVSRMLRTWQAISGFFWSLILLALVVAVVIDRNIKLLGADALQGNKPTS